MDIARSLQGSGGFFSLFFLFLKLVVIYCLSTVPIDIKEGKDRLQLYLPQKIQLETLTTDLESSLIPSLATSRPPSAYIATSTIDGAQFQGVASWDGLWTLCGADFVILGPRLFGDRLDFQGYPQVCSMRRHVIGC